MTVLSTVVLEFDVTRVDRRVDVKLRWVGLVPCSAGVSGTFHSEGEDDGVSIRNRVIPCNIHNEKQPISVPLPETAKLLFGFR